MIQLLLTLLLSPVLKLLAGRPCDPPRRILVIQMAKIGDLLCSTPVLRELRRCHPAARIEVMATAQNAPLLRVNPHIDAVVEADAKDFQGLAGKLKLIRLLRRGAYDTAVCLNAGAGYAVAVLWAGIPRRLAVQSNFGGFSHRLAARLWSASEPHRGDRLIQETYLALLARMGVAGGRIDKEVFAAAGAEDACDEVLGDAQSAPLIGIGVSSANRLKALGTEKIVAICRLLLAAQPAAAIVLVGGPDDRRQATAIAAALPGARIIDACGACGLAEVPALLARLTVFLGVDSGITYMADAVGIPLVSVAGPCNMDETRPIGRNVRVLLPIGLACAPCAHIFRAPYNCHVGGRACVVDMAAESIAAAVLEVAKNGAGR